MANQLTARTRAELRSAGRQTAEDWYNEKVDPYQEDLMTSFPEVIDADALRRAADAYKEDALHWAQQAASDEIAELKRELEESPIVGYFIRRYFDGLAWLRNRFDPGSFVSKSLQWWAPLHVRNGLRRVYGLTTSQAARVQLAAWPVIRPLLQPWWEAVEGMGETYYRSCRSDWLATQCGVKTRNYVLRNVDWLTFGNHAARMAAHAVGGDMQTVNTQTLLAATRRLMGGGHYSNWLANWGPSGRGRLNVIRSTVGNRTTVIHVYAFGYGSSEPGPDFRVVPGDADAVAVAWAPRANGSAVVMTWNGRRWGAVGQVQGVKAPPGQDWRALREGAVTENPNAELRGGEGAWGLPGSMPSWALPAALFLLSRS